MALWAHVDHPDVLLDVIGLTSSSGWREIAPYVELVDTRQPVDLILVAEGGTTHDVEPAVRLHFKDAKALFALFSTEFRLREEGDRVFARPRRADADASGASKDDASKDDAWVCDFFRGADAAVCGTPKAVGAVAEWSKPGPAPPPAIGRAPMLRVNAYAEALVPLVGDVFRGTKLGVNGGGDLAAFLSDAERFSFELGESGDRLTATAAWLLRSQVSRPAQDLLAPSNTAAMPDVFHRVVQETGTAVFVPGGGAMPRWIAELVRQMQSPGATAPPDGKPDPAGVLGSFVASPAVIGYGVRVDRARTAVGTARTARDAEKAVRMLDDALEPELVYALAAPIASVERAMRAVAAGSPRSAPSASGAPTLVVRAASPRLRLPKGAFVLEEKRIDWIRRAGAGSGRVPSPPVRTTYTLFAGAFDGVLGITCPAEELCADTYARLTSKAASARFDDELFERSGIVAAGWASSSAGVQQVNRIMLKTAALPLPPEVLANVERDLLAPRFALPFVVTTTREGAGGTITGEMRGSRDAFRAALDQGVLGSSWSIARALMIVFGGP